MTKSEYEQKKRECWENFKFARRPLNTDKKVFDYIFDRAYALGREKEAITQEEIEKAAEKYAKDAYYPTPDYNWYESDDEQMKEVLADTFKAGANFALGKQEKDADTVIQGWLVRDKDGTLNLFYGSDKPIKRGQDEYWSVVAGAVFEYLPREMFPDLTWESDPIEVELIIKRKKNG